MSRIELRGINKYYDKNHVSKDVSLVIEDGELITLLKPSGCGKTTTLRVVAGLGRPQKGYMYIGDREIVNTPEKFYEEPGKCHLNLAFQSYVPWPHMTISDNVAFGLKVAKVPKEGTRKRVENALKHMRTEAFIDRHPSELSGGQQQHVAIARAIVSEPEVLSSDESSFNLDAKLRIEMRSGIKRLHQELGTTIIYMTRDQTEALTMSIKIAILSEGVLEQMASPTKLYQSPAPLQVTDLIGNPKVNFLLGKARVLGDATTVESVLGTMASDKKSFTGEVLGDGSFEAAAGARPELVEILDGPAEGSIEAEVYSVMPVGSETAIYLEAGGERILSKQNGFKQYSPDQEVWLRINPDKMNMFSKDSGKLARPTVMDVQKDE